jgi:hypothetical protein
MDKGFEIEFRDDHVHVQLSPDYEIDASGRDEIWRRIKELCDENGTRRVLVEGKLPLAEPSTADIVDAGQHTATVPHLWLAFHFEDHVQSDRSEVFEAVAASKGVRVKHFNDREHALRWLRNNAPS